MATAGIACCVPAKRVSLVDRMVVRGGRTEPTDVHKVTQVGFGEPRSFLVPIAFELFVSSFEVFVYVPANGSNAKNSRRRAWMSYGKTLDSHFAD
jgi:hypothetical protein